MFSVCGKVCLPLTLLPHILFCQFVSSNAFLQTSLHKSFELIHFVKALATGCDMGFCVFKTAVKTRLGLGILSERREGLLLV